jgi:hypothetical protein
MQKLLNVQLFSRNKSIGPEKKVLVSFRGVSLHIYRYASQFLTTWFAPRENVHPFVHPQG